MFRTIYEMSEKILKQKENISLALQLVGMIVFLFAIYPWLLPPKLITSANSYPLRSDCLMLEPDLVVAITINYKYLVQVETTEIWPPLPGITDGTKVTDPQISILVNDTIDYAYLYKLNETLSEIDYYLNGSYPFRILNPNEELIVGVASMPIGLIFHSDVEKIVELQIYCTYYSTSMVFNDINVPLTTLGIALIAVGLYFMKSSGVTNNE